MLHLYLFAHRVKNGNTTGSNVRKVSEGSTFVGNDGKHQSYGHTYNNEIEDPLSWKHMLNSCNSTSGLQSQVKHLLTLYGMENNTNLVVGLSLCMISYIKFVLT